MKLYYFHDRFAHAQKNADGKDYTPAYLPAILRNLGFSAHELRPEALSTLEGGDLLVMGAEILSGWQADALKDALCRGCAVLAFGAKAPGVFPDTEPGVCGADQYETVGYFRFTGSEEPLPVLGGFEKLATGSVLGTVTAKNGSVSPVFVRVGENLWYFSFDLPATLLHAADGRPTLTAKNGFPFPVGRVPDGCVLEEGYDFDIAYCDSYLRGVEDILSACGFPRLWGLPAQQGQVCDLALYFSGDDEAESRENDFTAAEAMHSRGLPYHLNLMPGSEEGGFVLNREDVEYLHSIGCETAIHFNFLKFPYSEEGFRFQKELYEKTFGEDVGSPVNHCLVQVGTAPERYRIEAECGIRSDNNRFQNRLDPSDINAFNLSGFGFGHAFPRFVLADAAHGNRQLPLCEIYGSYYEPRIYHCLPEEYEKIEAYLNAGAAYGRPLQLFTHPHYISGKVGYDPQPALRALDHAIAHVSKMGWNAWYCGPEALGTWWHDRASCTTEQVSSTGFVLHNPTGHTVTVVLPGQAASVTADGVKSPVACKTVGGRTLKLLNLKPGTSRVSYSEQELDGCP